jgi:Cu/Ag efflux pump CusA
VWHVLPIKSPEDLAQVAVDRTAFQLRDVATVVEDHQPLIGDALVNDTSNLMLVIEKLPGMNTLEVTRGIEDALDALRPGFASIDFNSTLYRPATFIEMAIANLAQAAVIVALLVVLVLGVFFYGWRTALISLVAIPVSLLAALYVLYLRGATLNAMVLAGLVIALGVIFDDAIVDVDNILQRLRQNHREGNPKSAENVVLDAVTETRTAIFFPMLITLLAALPVFFMEDLSRALFSPLAVSYLLAVLASMAVALILTPTLCLILLPKANLEGRESPLVRWLQRSYEGTLARAVRNPRMAYVIVAS